MYQFPYKRLVWLSTFFSTKSEQTYMKILIEHFKVFSLFALLSSTKFGQYAANIKNKKVEFFPTSERSKGSEENRHNQKEQLF